MHIKRFFKDIMDVTKTRKFWVGLLGVVIDAVVLYLADIPEFSVVIRLLTLLGIYEVPNKKEY